MTIQDSYSATPELFSKIPSVITNSILSQDFTSNPKHVHQSELVNTDISALNSEQITVKIFDDVLTISKDRVTSRDTNDYTWFGSGDGINTVLVVSGAEITGSIETSNNTYRIDATNYSSVHILQDIDISKIAPEYGYADGEDEYENMAQTTSLTQTQRNLISQLEDVYDSDFDYRGEKVIIDVYVVYTEAADNAPSDVYRSITSQARLAIEKANDSYNDNHLPLELNLVDTAKVRNYVEVDMDTDRNNLLDSSNSFFARTHAEAEELDADVVILFTLNNDEDEFICGYAGDLLSDDSSTSMAVVKSTCVAGHSFTHEIGHLQGARHEYTRDSTITPFVYGHGWIDTEIKKRTIMAYDCDNDPNVDACPRQGIWSDPYDSFIGSAVPAGTENHNWNAKVLFATGPHIASLRGEQQNYDNISPSGGISLPVTTIVRGALLDVTATFDEEIHDKHPPHVTISDGTTSTTKQMTKSTGTVYTTTHQTTSEIGTVNFSFSNARDVYGNSVVPTPTSGSVVTIVEPNPNPVITAPSDRTFEATATNTPLDSSDYGIATATDDVDVNLTVTNDAPSTFSLEDTTIIWSATDSDGNTSTATQTVTITDTTPPTITLIGKDTVTVKIGSAYSDKGATAMDIVDGDISADITTDTSKVDTQILGLYTVTYTVSDTSGNQIITTRTVDVSATDLHMTVIGLATNSDYLDGAHDFEIKDGLAYVASYSSNRFSIYDVSNPASPIMVSSVKDIHSLGTPNQVEIEGNYAFVSTEIGRTLTIIDVSDTANPSVQSSLQYPKRDSYPFALAVKDNYAYVGDAGSSKLLIVNVTDKSNPQITTNIDMPNIANISTITLDGDLLYTTNNNGQTLSIIDVTDKSNPVIVSQTTNPFFFNSHSLQIQDDYAFVLSLGKSRLNVVDISDRVNPHIVGSLHDIENMGGASAVQVRGDYAFVVSWASNTLSMIDISEKNNPVLVESLKLSNHDDHFSHLEMVQDTAYLTGSGGDIMFTVDVNLP